jgi:FGGY-family pentulose kinase
MIAGTSSCHMAVSFSPRFIPGVWGPYFGAMVPGMWLNEGGQSATGSLIDHIIRSQASFSRISRETRKAGIDIYTFLNRQVDRLKKKEGLKIVSELHVLPYFHGNRSPRADPSAKGIISGLTLEETEKESALIYYATIQAIAYGTRHIIEAMNQKGYQINKVHLCGGHSKNHLFIQEQADITGCEMILPKEPEAVLLGAAILAAVAGGEYSDISQAMKSMGREFRVIPPDDRTFAFHQAKYEIFKSLYEIQNNMKRKMENIQNLGQGGSVF